jgi:TRAP-type C4-dicarboxylate transport system permease large subunit
VILGALPYLIAMFVVIALLVAVPEIALFLPKAVAG